MNQYLILDTQSKLEVAKNCLVTAFNNAKTHQVEIKEYKRDRSLAQNRLQHHWYRQMYEQRFMLEEFGGWSIEDFRSHNKLEFGVPIMMAYPEFNADWTAITANLSHEHKKKAALWVPMTRIMTVEEMTWFLTEVENEWSPKGFRLTTGDDLYFEAMGLRR